MPAPDELAAVGQHAAAVLVHHAVAQLAAPEQRDAERDPGDDRLEHRALQRERLLERLLDQLGFVQRGEFRAPVAVRGGIAQDAPPIVVRDDEFPAIPPRPRR